MTKLRNHEIVTEAEESVCVLRTAAQAAGLVYLCASGIARARTRAA